MAPDAVAHAGHVPVDTGYMPVPEVERPGPVEDASWRVGRPAALVIAVVAPIAVSAGLTALRGTIANPTSALVLVLVVVGVACLGRRSAGLTAAAVAGLSFDYFLTEPYLTFSVTDPGDVETLVALVLVGVAVTEVVRWGQRYQAQLGDRDAYLNALLAISDREPGWVKAVGRYLTALLDLDDCSWVEVVGPDEPRLGRDGEMRLHGQVLPADDGLPIFAGLVLPVRPEDPASPGFVLIASAHVARPSLRRRRLASALADQVGWALAQERSRAQENGTG